MTSPFNLYLGDLIRFNFGLRLAENLSLDCLLKKFTIVAS